MRNCAQSRCGVPCQEEGGIACSESSGRGVEADDIVLDVEGEVDWGSAVRTVTDNRHEAASSGAPRGETPRGVREINGRDKEPPDLEDTGEGIGGLGAPFPSVQRVRVRIPEDEDEYIPEFIDGESVDPLDSSPGSRGRDSASSKDSPLKTRSGSWPLSPTVRRGTIHTTLGSMELLGIDGEVRIVHSQAIIRFLP